MKTMRWTINRVTDPTAEFVTTTDAKKHLRVEEDDEDTYIDELVVSAREYLEERTNSSFMRQTWDYFADCWPDGRDAIELPRGPLLSVTSVKYTTTTSTTAQTLSATAYVVDRYSVPARVALRDGQVWPTDLLRDANGVEVRFVAGYSSSTGSGTTGVPQRAHQAVKLLVGRMYTDREDVTDAAPAAQKLIRQLDRRRYI